MTEERETSVFLRRRSYRQRRLQDAARMLPIIGFVLWLIPLLWPRSGESAADNASALVYIFSVWVILIVLTLVIARRVRPAPGPQEEVDDGQL